MSPRGVASIVRLVQGRSASAHDVATETLRALAEVEPAIHATIQVLDEEALDQAGAVDARITRGEDLPLAGVPIVVKDNICTSFGRTTCASRMLEHYRSPFDATCVARLLRAGAVIVGKSNLDEFAMGSSTEHSAFHPTRNPWDTTRIPGGSSGGSAAAVAARAVPAALGSDTGGSVRQPAGHCGVVGVKPTYGVVSRWGLVAFASSLDQVGTFGVTVEDAALLLDAIAGHDPLDATSSTRPYEPVAPRLDDPIPGLALGVPRQARSPANHPGVSKAFDDAVRMLESRGARIVELDLPRTDLGIAAYYVIALAEASSNLARYDGVRYGRAPALAQGASLDDLYTRARAEGLGPEVKRRILLGTHVLSSGYYDAYYATAVRARAAIREEFRAAFAGEGPRPPVHAILTPTSPGPAFRIGEKSGPDADPLALYLEDAYTVGVNLAGLPAASVPMGFVREDSRDLPVGMQVIGWSFDESAVLRVARLVERAAALAPRLPPIHASHSLAHE